MVNVQSLDPSASPLDYYGWELRRQREAHGLKQSQVGEIIYCTGSLIGQIEATSNVNGPVLVVGADAWRTFVGNLRQP